jgi:hypothetical protein
MTDIAKDLRDEARYTYGGEGELMEEAAAEIERLRGLLRDCTCGLACYIDRTADQPDAGVSPAVFAEILESVQQADAIIKADQQNAMSTGACYCQLHDRYSIDGCPECRMPTDKTKGAQ